MKLVDRTRGSLRAEVTWCWVVSALRGSRGAEKVSWSSYVVPIMIMMYITIMIVLYIIMLQHNHHAATQTRMSVTTSRIISMCVYACVYVCVYVCVIVLYIIMLQHQNENVSNYFENNKYVCVYVCVCRERERYKWCTNRIYLQVHMLICRMWSVN